MRTNTIDREIQEEREQFKRARQARKNKIKGKRSNNNLKYKFNLNKIFTILSVLGTLGILVVMTLLYGPWEKFREWLVTTAMTTMTHQYYATWFYDEETINYILDKNKVIETDETTDTNFVTTGTFIEETEYRNEYEKAVLERNSNNNDYKIIEINEKKYDGYLVAVYDSSRIKAVVTKNLGISGQYVTKMSSDNNALIAINGGGFDDPNYNGTGGSPLGVTIVSDAIASRASYNGVGGVIGFDSNDKLVLGKMSLAEAQSKGIRDAVTFGPFLIINGKVSKVLGNGGWGTAPRTAIGQRKDGIVLFLVLNGRKASKPGADMDDLIEIMKNYGAYNAANLDGGTSSVLVVNDTIVNDPIDSTGAHRTRPVASAFIVTKDSSDNSDHSIVEDKLK